MAYTLQAILARSGTLSEPLLDQLKLVRLLGGVDLIPLGRDALKAYALPFLPLTDEGHQDLPSTLAKLCERLSVQGQVAYVEAEVFGGAGTQAHALYSAGKAVGPVVVSDSAINEALRHIGVVKRGATDEFDAIGLGQHRDTDGWLT
jgi:hypothetical protein